MWHDMHACVHVCAGITMNTGTNEIKMLRKNIYFAEKQTNLL